MRRIQLESIKRDVVYGNWKMLSPTGVLMCRLSDKKAQWYVAYSIPVPPAGEQQRAALLTE